MRTFITALSLSALIISSTVYADECSSFFQALLAALTSSQSKMTTGQAYYEQLMSDLKNLNSSDRKDIGNKFKEKVPSRESLSEDAAYHVAKTIILMHGEQETRQVATAFFNNRDIIEKNVTSQYNNIRVVLEKSEKSCRIDGKALANCLGDKLFSRLEKVAHHPEYERYLKKEWQTNVNTLPVHYRPTPPPTPQQQKSLDAIAYQNVCDGHEFILKQAGVPLQQRETYKKLFWSSCQNCTNSVDIARCSKRQIREVLCNNLAAREEQLIHAKVATPTVINRAAQDVERAIAKDISDDAEMPKVHVVAKYTQATLEDTITDAIIKHS